MNVSQSFFQLLRWAVALLVLCASGDIAASSRAFQLPLEQRQGIAAGFDSEESMSDTAAAETLSAHQALVEVSPDDEAPALTVSQQPCVAGCLGAVPGAVFLEEEEGGLPYPTTPKGRLRYASAQARAPPAAPSAS